MNNEDANYYRARAEQEREAARFAADRYIADIHLELARQYEALANEPTLRPKLRIAV